MIPRAARRGFGLIIGLAVFFVLVFSIASISLGQLGSSVKLDVQSGQAVSSARFVAQAALEELAYRIAVAANDPQRAGDARAPFTLFRQTAWDAGGGTVDVLPDLKSAAPYLPSFLDAKNGIGAGTDVALTGALARILYTRYYRSARPPWHQELYGTLALEVHAGVKRRGAVVSEIIADKWLEFKVVRTTIPPPFDQFAFTMFEPEPWVDAHARFSSSDPRENVDQLILTILKDDIPEAQRQIARFKEIDRKLDQLNDPELTREIRGGVADAERVLAEKSALLQYWNNGPPVADFRFFPNPHLRYLMPGAAKLDEVNLPGYMVTAAPERLRLDADVTRMRQELDRELKKSAPDLKAIDRIAGPLRRESFQELNLDMDILETARRINSAFVKRVGTGEIETFEPHRAVLATGFDLITTPAAGGTSISAGRITHAVDRPNVKQRLIDLLQAYGQPFNGIIEVRNVGEDLVLSAADAPAFGAFEGRATIVVRGNLTLTDFRVAKGSMCFVCQGKLRASGQVDASLVALTAFDPVVPLKVKGDLLLDADCFRAAPRAEQLVAGIELADDPSIRALDPANPQRALPQSYRVLFGPRPIYETSLRQQAGRSKL